MSVINAGRPSGSQREARRTALWISALTAGLLALGFRRDRYATPSRARDDGRQALREQESIMTPRQTASWSWQSTWRSPVRIRSHSSVIFGYARSGQNHSHSILSTHRNALIYQRKNFLLTDEIRPSVRQIFSLLISKGKSRDSNSVWLRQLSPTIDQFFALSLAERILLQDEKDRQHL